MESTCQSSMEMLFIFICKIYIAGPPIIADLTVLNNRTSTVVPLSWFIESDGGYAPVTFTVFMKLTGKTEYYIVMDNIHNYASDRNTMNFDVVELLPETQYEFKVRAKNDRTGNAFSGNISNFGDTMGGMTAF